ncbi:site-specific integrase [Methylobacterium sp. WL120]|uniref:tyrosine-type recombinase/integrase n=1 Tax=Methylobacterium sp. WL120 TaxID=2603887 RepID=UPI0011C88C0D|nr:site-specific integrase [Methylobacterium sp. WL120]TXM64519.1 tyrosine-type recombinase/integrase [Methylobacterium sp. WL120]
MPKLSKRTVDAAVPREVPFFVWCSDLPGFGVRVFPSGRRVYYADYRTKGGTRRRMSLGAHGKITVDEARKLAIVTLGDVIKGEDPANERATRRGSMTVAELCDAYLAAADAGLIMGKGGASKKASTLYVDRGRIERHIKPLLGKRLVVELIASDVQRFVRDVQIGKTAAVVKTGFRGKAVVEGGPGTAARTVGLLGGILSYAVSENIITANPATGVKRPADRKRKRRLTADEYAALGRVLAAAEATQAERWQAVAGVRLLALTGCRLSEIVRLLWVEVDRGELCLRLEDTKEGASVRPIGRAVLAILDGLDRTAGSTYALPASRGSGAFVSLDDALERITVRAGLEGVTAHTLRHSFASVAGDLGYSDSTIGAMLGHAGSTVTSRYVHHLDAVLVAAADRVSEAIAAALEDAADGMAEQEAAE